jgi:dipeptide/tripeptide permease
MMWLTSATYFQTIGSYRSARGLSSMTKLAPAKFGGQMMGV